MYTQFWIHPLFPPPDFGLSAVYRRRTDGRSSTAPWSTLHGNTFDFVSMHAALWAGIISTLRPRYRVQMSHVVIATPSRLLVVGSTPYRSGSSATCDIV